jgi:hypothetical protein
VLCNEWGIALDQRLVREKDVGVLIAIIVALAVMWLKPSAAQQRQMRLRLCARQLGLDVRLSALPQIRRARVRAELPQQGVVYRLLRFGDKAESPLTYLVCRADAQSEWESESDAQLSAPIRAELDRVLAQLPSDVIAFEITPLGCGVYWRERGDEETVRLLKQLLESMQRVLVGGA